MKNLPFRSFFLLLSLFLISPFAGADFSDSRLRREAIRIEKKLRNVQEWDATLERLKRRAETGHGEEAIFAKALYCRVLRDRISLWYRFVLPPYDWRAYHTGRALIDPVWRRFPESREVLVLRVRFGHLEDLKDSKSDLVLMLWPVVRNLRPESWDAAETERWKPRLVRLFGNLFSTMASNLDWQKTHNKYPCYSRRFFLYDPNLKKPGKRDAAMWVQFWTYADRRLAKEWPWFRDDFSGAEGKKYRRKEHADWSRRTAGILTWPQARERFETLRIFFAAQVGVFDPGNRFSHGALSVRLTPEGSRYQDFQKVWSAVEATETLAALQKQEQPAPGESNALREFRAGVALLHRRDLLHHLGWFLKDQGALLRDARRHIEAALDRAPQNPFVVEAAARAAYRGTDLKRARRLRMRLVDLLPNDAGAYVLAAQVHLAMLEYYFLRAGWESGPLLEDIGKIIPSSRGDDPPTRKDLSALRAAALLLARKALALEPKSRAAKEILAALEALPAGLEDMPGEKALEHLAALDSGKPAARTGKKTRAAAEPEVLQEKRSPNGLTIKIVRADARRPSHSSSGTVGKEFWRQFFHQQREKAVKEVLAHPDDPEAHMRLLSTYQGEARQCLTEEPEHYPVPEGLRNRPELQDLLETCDGMYQILVHQKPRRALPILDAVLKRNPRYALALAWKGNALILSGRPEEGRKCLERALAVDPQCRDALGMLANYHQRKAKEAKKAGDLITSIKEKALALKYAARYRRLSASGKRKRKH